MLQNDGPLTYQSGGGSIVKWTSTSKLLNPKESLELCSWEGVASGLYGACTLVLLPLDDPFFALPMHGWLSAYGEAIEVAGRGIGEATSWESCGGFAGSILPLWTEAGRHSSAEAQHC
jgi:hypothetical protein